MVWAELKVRTGIETLKGPVLTNGIEVASVWWGWGWGYHEDMPIEDRKDFK